MREFKPPGPPLKSPVVNEDVRIALLACLPPYLSRCATAPEAASLSFLALGTRDAKEATRKACLKAAGATLLAAPRTRWVRVGSTPKTCPCLGRGVP